MMQLNATLFELVVTLVGHIFCVIVLALINRRYDRIAAERLAQTRAETELLKKLGRDARQLERAARDARIEAQSLLDENRALAAKVVELQAAADARDGS